MAKRILVVDDDENILNLEVAILEQKGFDVTGATGTEDALSILSYSSPFDLILSDVMMPDPDGFSLCRQIKADPKHRETPVIFLTAKGGGEALAEGFEAGAIMYVNKPFTANKLLTIVATMLESGINLDEKGTVQPPLDASPPDQLIPTGPAPEAAPLLKALAAIVGGFCHDLGNSLTGVAAVDLVRTMPDHRRRDEWLGWASTALADAQALTADLHDLVRQFYLGDAAPLESISGAAFEATVRGLVATTLAKGVDLRLDCEGVRHDLRFPRVLLRHLLLPLVGNASEAIEANGGKGTVHLTARSSPFSIDLCVVDDGPGWGDRLAVARRALERGERLSTKGAGRGSGLANVYRVASSLGGHVHIDRASHLGGARVEISVPWKELS